MSAKTRWILGSAALAIVVVLVALVRSALAPTMPAARGDREASPAPPDLARVFSTPLGGATRDARRALESAPGGPDPEADTATLVVEVVRWRDGAPVAGAGVAVSDPGGQGSVKTTDASGTVVLRVPAGRGLLVGAWVDDGTLELGLARLRIAALAVEERRAVRVELPDAREVAFWGRVVDRASGVPLAGARIEGQARAPDAVASLVSDASGLFHATVVTGRPAPLRVEADGYGTAIAVARPGHERPETALEIGLERCAALRAVVRGFPGGVTRVVLLAQVTDLVRSDGVPRIEPSEFRGLESLSWRGTLDADGACSFDCLPARVPLTAHLGGTRAAWRSIGEEVVLEPGEERRVEWDLTSTIRGRVLDQHGSPVSWTQVWCLPEPGGDARPTARSFRPAEGGDVRYRTSADEGGTFEIAGVTRGSWWVGVAPRNRGVEVDPQAEVTSDATLVHVAEPGDYACAVDVWRGTWIQGSVRAPDGSPAVRAFVEAWSADRLHLLEAYADADGRFALGPLRPGAHRLQASSGVPQGFATSDTVGADAGARDVVLTLKGPGTIAGRVAGVPRGTSRVAYHLTGSEEGSFAEIAIGSDGSFALRGLRPGRYDLTLRGPEQTIAVVRGIEVAADSEAPTGTIALEPGATLRVRYEGVERHGMLSVESGGASVASDGISAGTEITKTVPAGRLRVVVRDQAGRSAERTLDLAPGALETIVLTLE